MTLKEYDIIVVGAGHAGCEASHSAATMGKKVLLITMDMEKICQMSCNPAMGGIAKGQIVREIDALGGMSGIITDRSSIQFRMLNRSKGPAMWSPRSQCDRHKFSALWRQTLEANPNIDIWQDHTIELLLDNTSVVGVKTRLGIEFKSKAVILTNGTFLNGLMHIGRVQMNGGRIAEQSAVGISDQLKSLGLEVGRMKTGTPARVDGRSINFDKLSTQHGDENPYQFSYLPINTTEKLKQRPCYIAHTNPKVHRILERGFKDSPLYNGTIQSIGPRYCPSIEDKLVTFADKDSHHLFIEPESENGIEYYINGFSSSLPWDVQWSALREVEGFENIQLFRPGYAIEYDFIQPTQLLHTLETKLLTNLYLAGQINGTTGYEEAASQGLMAGINACLKIDKKEPFILKRNEAYIGVLIDDLVTKGVDEPYRMFTSRAEYRIVLRQDNADERLTEKAFNIGLSSEERLNYTKQKLEIRDKIISFIKQESIKPEEINQYLTSINTSPIQQKLKIEDILLRPQVSLNDLINNIPSLSDFISTFKTQSNLVEIIESAEIQLKYKGYIEREQQNAEKLLRLEQHTIPSNFDYNKIESISTEARIKLNKIKPITLGQASRIPGVSPADINILLLYFGR